MTQPSARRVQRLGAYAVVLRGSEGAEELLVTRVSALGFPPGAWALPGGGVDHGESPRSAVERELWEETGLRCESADLVEVHDVHLVEPGRGDIYEDYHGVHLVYSCTLTGNGAPHVMETDGTTDLAAWVPVADLRDGRMLLPVVDHVLGRLDYFRG